eukprot:jgi/Mesvir1/18430/Mv14297-RA.1
MSFATQMDAIVGSTIGVCPRLTSAFPSGRASTLRPCQSHRAGGSSQHRHTRRGPCVARMNPSGSDRDQNKNGAMQLLLSGMAKVLLAGAVVATELATPALLLTPPEAQAVLRSPTAKLPRSAEVALRRAIPAVNADSKEIQSNIEEVQFGLRIPNRKPYRNMAQKTEASIKLLTTKRASILASVPEAQRTQGEALIDELINGKFGLTSLANAIEQEDPDRIGDRVNFCLSKIAELEMLQAPGLPYALPAMYKSLPILSGRAVVELTVASSGKGFVLDAGGGPKKQGVLEITLDGYSAPISAGNFARLASKGFYDGVKLQVSPENVLAVGLSNPEVEELPLEIQQAGEFEPRYRVPLDLDEGEFPIIPMSIYGAVCLAHAPSNPSASSSSDFFIYLYDKRNSGLGGVAFDEGQFTVIGYVTSGSEILSQLKSGETIKSMKLVSGAERLSG